MAQYTSPDGREPNSPVPSSSSGQSREINGLAAELDDPESAVSMVARFLEQLHTSISSPVDREQLTSSLLSLARDKKEACVLIGTHSQAMPLFISILRSGPPAARSNVASLLSTICKEEELRVRVLLGGCVPPLLAMLKSDSVEGRKVASEAIYEVSSGRFSDDHIGMKIFVTEGVVPTLWAQLSSRVKKGREEEGFLTGALRNLCREKDGYWRATLEAGGVEIITNLLSSGNPTAQSNSASLLARLVSAFGDSVPKVIDAGAVRALIRLLGKENDISARASAADALEVLSLKSTVAKKAVVDAGGLPVLIGSIVAPSKECMRGGDSCRSLQNHSVRALSNICGGTTSLVYYLAELSKSCNLPVPLDDILGALAYALMVFVENDEQKVLDPVEIETNLIELLKPGDEKLVQDRVLEALASLYNNSYICCKISNAVAKRVLIGLITIASHEIQEQLIPCLTKLCRDDHHVTLWEALGNREGVQLLISLLGLSSEQQQEYAVSLLSVLTNEIDESKWAITAAGGIPPLVQLLETGSSKAREDAAHVLWNLCCHSDDIRACVESAGAVPSLLWLLKSGGSKGQEASAKALKKLIRQADGTIINQLLVLISSELIGESKCQAVTVLGHVLMLASYNDLVHDGSIANKGLKALILVLNSSDEEMQERAASVLADLFNTRPDICDSLETNEVVNPCMRLLTSSARGTATQSARALGAFSRRVTNARSRTPYLEKNDVVPLITMAKSANTEAAQTAITALANLLSDPNIAREALDQDIVPALQTVLKEGNLEGKKSAARCLYQLLLHFPLCNVVTDYVQCKFTVHLLVDWVTEVDVTTATCLDGLTLLSFMVRAKENANFGKPVWAAIADTPEKVLTLVKCLDLGLSDTQDKAIEILSRVCQEETGLVGQYLGQTQGCILSLADRVINSLSLEVKIGAAGLLICAVRERRDETVSTLYTSELSERIVGSLVDVMRRDFSAGSLQIEVWNPKSYSERDDDFTGSDPARVFGGTVANWLLVYLCSACAGFRVSVMEAGGVEILCDHLSNYTSDPEAEYGEIDGIWRSALLLSVLFQDQTVIQSSPLTRIIPCLVSVLKSDEIADRFFSAQVLSSLVKTGDKAIQLSVANSGAIPSLIALIGHTESNLTALSEEFILPADPSYAIMKSLLELDEVVTGAIARKSVHFLVDLLRPMADRPGAPLIALELLTSLAEASDANKIAIAESGAIDALTKYLSLSPQDSTETAITKLLAILYTNSAELLSHESSLSTLNQLLAVLRLGSRKSRFFAAKALKELFRSDGLRDTEMARQAIQPLVDMLNLGNESEQRASLSALIKLTSNNLSKASALSEIQGDPLDSLCKILSFSSSLELKKEAAQLCCILFQNPFVRHRAASLECIRPLTQLVMSGSDSAMGPAVSALDLLLEDEDNASVVASNELIETLVKYVSPENYDLAESSLSALIKLGKDRPNCKAEMMSSGVIERSLGAILDAPATVGSLIVELFRILTNNSTIARSSVAAKMVEPLFLVLQRPDFTVWGQHSALQALINILEKAQSFETLKLTPSEAIEPLIVFLESPSPAIQQLGTEVLMHLLEQEQFKFDDTTTLTAVAPLVRLAGIGIISLQQTAIRALESISVSCPRAVADAGGISELSKVIVQDDPLPSSELWESAALVLSNVLKSSKDHYVKISIMVLVKLLSSSVETVVSIALSALLVQQKHSTSCAVSIAEAGAVQALLALLKSHRCEESAARLLEALFNNVRVREKKIARYAVGPLAQYLLDPVTKCQPAKLLVTLCLGDLFQHETLARSRDSVSACRALVNVLEDQPNEDITIVAVCALQSLVMNSRTNRRAVAESGGVLVVQELLLHSSFEVAAQAAALIRHLFANHTLQEYVSNELIRSLTAALEKELLSSSTINKEILRTIHTIFANFKKLRMSEAATLCIPHLVAALRSGSEPAQESVLDTLCLLRESWPLIGEDIAKAQALIAAEAIPDLQLLIKNCPPSFHDRVDSLLHCLPGCLTVTVKKGSNLKQTMASTNAFCCLKIGNGPPKETRVVNHSSNPEWKEAFTWAFDIPPKGQKLYIICKSKSTFGKSTLGRVTIQIDKVLTEGIYSGLFSLSHDGGKDSSRTLEIEIVWSNRTSGNTF